MTSSLENPVRVFLIDDHPMVREGLGLVLSQSGFQICGEAGSLAETLAHPELASARIAILDLALGDENSTKFIPVLRKKGLDVVVYSMYEEAFIIRQVLSAGAMAYITKREAASSLVEALHSVLAGREYLSPRATDSLTHSVTAELSDQQQRLYDLLGQGYNNDEIATRLRISSRTVESYCVRLMNKMSMNGMKELRRRAIADGQRGLM